MEHWIGALRDRNIDAFMEVYWPEAEKVTLQRDGGEQVLRGFGQIREQQILAFERSDVFRQPHYSEPDREFHGNGAAYHYRVEGPGVFFVEHFEFVRPEGRWAIMHQVIDLRAGERPEGMAEDREPPRATSDFQAWADGNRNGMLEPPELREFLEAVRALVQETVSATPGRPIPSFDERLEQLGWQEERVAQVAGTTEKATRFEDCDMKTQQDSDCFLPSEFIPWIYRTRRV